MRALMYLTRRSLVNNLKKAVQKPSTLIALIFAIGYGIFIVVSLGGLAVSIRLDSVRGLLIIITAWCIYATLGNFMAYSSRKGILFKPAHAHFVFTAPISPKVVLLNSAWMNYVLSVVLWAVLAIGGLTVFQVAPWKVLLLILAGGVMELALEVSVMVFLYTNDRLPEKLMKGIRTFIKVFLIGFTLLVVLYFRKNGMTVGSASEFVDWDVLQMIPVIGWQIAAYRLILLGPTLLNVICSCLYAASVIVSVAAVSRMQCNGGYYEEAAKFADDYAEIKKRQKNGETVFGISGKKRKFRQVRERISAKGAKAIFYRQLLEYKKEKFFIFSKVTLIAAVIAFFLCYTLRDAAMETGVAEFFLLGVIAYMSIVMSGYLGKWENELKNPYLYLIPDTPMKKLWYATLMEHVKALVDGCIICIPVGIFWHVKPVYVVFCILIYAVLQADRLYTKVIAQCLVGEIFGKTGQDVLRMCVQFALLGMGAGVAVIVGIFINTGLIFPILLVYSVMVTAAMGFLASLRFETMEQFV
ncbi:MAG TPA: putative ABC exporter domain-containing protein [Candidatus Mediterraneibacter tabaqchaliae]|uniref:ABC exporter domain-containing protein n=1 Tax=Candidatus Mediterraneibacter tabaqchaliae TaxID=2838689 RepID=A0A9D2R7X2_9FIRM|nr:putative ABC exporter domain-containing protein [Candidatus Mediterraneibacter tabaqchaliae]